MQVENPQELVISSQFPIKWDEQKLESVFVAKHPQFILAVDATYFAPFSFHNDDKTIVSINNFKDGINAYPAAQWLKEVQNYVVIARREMLDNQININKDGNKYTGNHNFRQILPYCAICQILPTGEKLYFPYFRTDKVGESKLANKVSVGYGGHIDAPDVVYLPNADINLKDTILGSAMREIMGEETVIYNEKGEVVSQAEVTFAFADQFITQNTDPEILHLGVIMNMILPLGYRLKSGEDELETMEPMTARQLLSSEYTLEAWTRAMLEADVAEQKTKLIDKLDVAVDLAGDLKTQVQANGVFLEEEESKIVGTVLNPLEPLDVAIGGEEVVDTSGLLLDGQEMNTASFNQMVIGDSSVTPTHEQISAFLEMDPTTASSHSEEDTAIAVSSESTIGKARGMNSSFFHIDELGYRKVDDEGKVDG